MSELVIKRSFNWAGAAACCERAHTRAQLSHAWGRCKSKHTRYMGVAWWVVMRTALSQP